MIKKFLLKLAGWEKSEKPRESNWTKAAEAQGETGGFDNSARKQRDKEALDKLEEEQKLFEQQAKKLDELEQKPKSEK